ncbi:acyltransferase [Rhodopseudomonas sp. BR0G17]|uniref:acyltransferase family protein n=1 Tax=Rhodopseudomonas sp. BR0G17 TaxID=2269368 RepID=UPI0013E0C9F9|nr:acyltransferase [Rhodopseudomonas sp. BR0G17]NEW97911.1 acyltransferase [Rhodopseudomonas sp. BR0G17]
MSLQSLGDRLDASAGRPSGFDYMKVSLAVMVIATHSVLTSYGQAADAAMWDTPARPFLRSVLPMFFGVSGFLVAASLDRCKTLIKFFGLRAIRIFPALTVEVLLSAFLIGPMLTTLALSDYFTDKLFFLYLLNAIGEIHYLLPGVFQDNPKPDIVNAQLWTVPFELYTYGAIGLLAIAGVQRYRILGPISVGVLIVFHFVARLWWHGWQYLPFNGNVPGFALMISGIVGLSLYYYRYEIPWRWSVFWGATAVALLGMYSRYGGEYFGALVVPYVAIFLGLTTPRRLAIVRDRDYSYGMYLYGFVIQQTFAATIPSGRVWWINILVCVPLAAILAAMSWHFVERPAQQLKSLVGSFEKQYLRIMRRTTVVRGSAPVRADA